ncbi:putative vacuolar membrane protein [Rosellinia necatrix]|uniref:Putative vacuolar membrane protein n=1 Tax=Rosellinia necatrix TaxID=77044 RepID=A0A1W2TCF4_ROSNE|nr:putative vacuolar membrane protein [Rosellinia necatrix]
MSIHPLPDSVIAQIKSSTAITTLNGAVCGLFRNCLDSRATKVTISIDYARGGCSVEDDGLGILPAEFKPSGGLGKLHYTSKYPAHDCVHGKSGAFLASLASLSLMSITSHHHKYHTHNSIQIHNSNILARHTPSPPDQRVLSFSHGTRVTVRDLFGSMPVRVKQRAIDAERGMHSKYWESLKRDITALMLAWDGCVSVSVRESTNRWTFSVCGAQAHRDSEHLVSNITVKVSRILHQARLSDEYHPGSWVPLRASAGSLSIVGAVSLHPTATKRVQFISIGIRPVPNEHGSNVLYEEINRIFSNSSFGVEESDKITGQEHDKEVNEMRGFTNQELRGRKGVDRWPMFFINIRIGESASPIEGKEIDELLEESHGNLIVIMDMLKAVIYEFLKKYYFRPRRGRSMRNEMANKGSRSNSARGTPSGESDSRSVSAIGSLKKHPAGDLATTKLHIRRDHESRPRPESPFDLWSRIKSGSPQVVQRDRETDKKLTGDEYQTSNSFTGLTSNLGKGNCDPITPLFGLDGSLLRAPFDIPQSIASKTDQGQQSIGVEEELSDQDISWQNPITNETSLIDSRTGFIRGPASARSEEGSGRADLTRRKRLRAHVKPTPGANRSVWLDELLSSWENPIFKITEPRIPTSFSEQQQRSDPLISSFGDGAWLRDPQNLRRRIQSRVSKAALARAEIVAQVDRKFIFAKVPLDSSTREVASTHPTASLLVIIDQHAADERCQVESLMKSYFTDPTRRDEAIAASGTPRACAEVLERPLQFDMSARDAAQLERTTAHFAHWGIHYRVLPVFLTKHDGYRQVEVTRLPPSIAERCRVEPRLLAELVREEAWKMDEHRKRDPAAKSHTTEESEVTTTPHWVTRLHGCPEGVLDMINSRACRSSIMFNDPLSLEECADLLKRLADCAFPFQCAHGRPSMVPLVDLGDNMAYTANKGRPEISFGKAFKLWNAEGQKKDGGD